MPFGLPAIGEGTWGQKILDSINAVKATADAAQVAADLEADVAATVGTDGALDTALSATYARGVSLLDPAFGVVLDGTAEDAARMQTMLDSPLVRVIYAPEGEYLADGLTLPEGKALIMEPAVGYSWTPTTGTRLKARLASQTAPVLTLAGENTVTDGHVVGNSNTAAAIKFAGPHNTLRYVGATGAILGIDGNYQGVAMLIGCWSHNNSSHGLSNIRDAEVIGGYYNANGGSGIDLQTGANDVTLTGPKLEWNNARGLNAYQANNLTLNGPIIDRNGLSGIKLNGCAQVVGHAVTRRNGRLASAAVADDNHLYQQNSSGVSLTLVTASGEDDGGGGYASPLKSVRHEGGTNVFVAGHLGGCTDTAAPVATITAGTRVHNFMATGLSTAQELTQARVSIGTGSQAAIAAAANAVFTFTTDTIGTFNPGQVYEFTIWARNHSTAARRVGRARVLISRESGAASATLGTVTNDIGTDFAASAGTFNISVATNTDGSSLTVTIANGSASTQTFYARLT